MSNIGQEREDDLRRQAVTALKKRRDFYTHALVYLLFNSAVVSIWLVTGAHGFFWPVFLIAFWGIGLVMNAWDVYLNHEPTEQRIEQEMERLRDH